MKLIVVCMTLIVCTMAQRPSYAGSGPIGRPSLGNRFREQDPETTTVNLNNRLGETTERIPLDARGDNDLVNRLNQWPREHRPFWLLNAEHIEAARNPSTTTASTNQVANRNNFENGGTITAKPVPHRSPFLPPLNSGS